MLSVLLVSTIYMGMKDVHIVNSLLAFGSVMNIFYLIIKNKQINQKVVRTYLIVYSLIIIDLILLKWA